MSACVCAPVCVLEYVYVCVGIMCACVCDLVGGGGGGGRLLPIYVCLFFSQSGLFSYFFQIKALLISEKDKS